ncbi:MAG: BrnT family toxin [Chloroflexi bacterium]|nr:BrnT family toxin [Chloroflexota bacterium]
MTHHFEWSARKAARNKEKHDVTFEEASSVFRDPLALIFDDEAHSLFELRELIIGYSDKNRVLVVSFVEREHAIRIISARKATKRERQDYEDHRYRIFRG